MTETPNIHTTYLALEIGSVVLFCDKRFGVVLRKSKFADFCPFSIFWFDNISITGLARMNLDAIKIIGKSYDHI